MPTQPIPFGVNQQSGLSELGGGAPALMNVVVDSLGAVSRRPGLSAYSLAPSTSIDSDGISGLYVPSNGELFAVSDAPSVKVLYRVLAGGATSLGNVGGTGRPVFAETEAMVAVTARGPISKLLLDGNVLSDLAGDSPLNASHVIANNNRLLANDLVYFKNQVFFSDQSAGSSTTGNETWAGGTSGYFSSDARPDPIVAVHENSNEVYVFGTTNVQVFVSDQSLVYATTTTRENGCIAPYSVIKVDQEFAWMDHSKRFVVGTGRGVEVISDPIQRDLDAIVDPTDCFGYRAEFGDNDVLVWTFPADGRSFVFSKKSGWSQWSGWNSDLGVWKRFAVNAYFQRPDTGDSVVGTTDGKIALFDIDADDDLGEEINASCTTGFIDRGTSKLKCTTAMRLVLRRGTTTDTTAQVALLSYRDDFGPFSTPLPVDLGATGERYTVIEYRSLGVYRSRQWKLQFLGTDRFELVSAEEDFTVQGV